MAYRQQWVEFFRFIGHDAARMQFPHQFHAVFSQPATHKDRDLARGREELRTERPKRDRAASESSEDDRRRHRREPSGDRHNRRSRTPAERRRHDDRGDRDRGDRDRDRRRRSGSRRR